jgi:hypothetical protein
MNIIAHSTSSKGVNVSEIQSLTSRVQDLTRSVNFWNKWYIAAVAVTVIATFLVFWVQFMSMRRSSEREPLQEQLAKLKDNQSALDIARAGAEASKANVKAVQLRQKNLEMEADISPRVLEQKESAKELELFSGTSVIFISLADSEPWRLTGQIAFTLASAKWNVLPGMQRSLLTEEFPDGVKVEINVGLRPDGDKSAEAAEALVKVLKRNNIEAHVRPHGLAILPLNTVVVRVGLKPGLINAGHGGMLYK